MLCRKRIRVNLLTGSQKLKRVDPELFFQEKKRDLKKLRRQLTLTESKQL